MKVNVKFANGNGMAFLGQGYITSDDKKVFVRLYTTSDLTHNAVNTEYAVEFLNDYNAVKENGFMYECRHLCDGSPSRTRIEFDF
jgi:hypothetical protein